MDTSGADAVAAGIAGAAGRRIPNSAGARADELPVLQTDGFSAHVDACAWEPPQLVCGASTASTDEAPRHAQLWMVSLLGAQQAVKALWARLLKGERATLRFPRPGGLERVQFCALPRNDSGGPLSWRFFSAGLPAAAGHHGVLVPVSALHACERLDFLLLPRQMDEAASLHFRFLNRRIHLPLHPGWAEWLWARALRTGEAFPLKAHGALAYRCGPDPERLAAELSRALASGRLRVDDVEHEDEE